MPEKDIIEKIVEILRMKKLLATSAYVAVIVAMYTELSKMKSSGSIGDITLDIIDTIFSSCKESFLEDEKK